ncbi:hypothetical protein PIB30_083283 [Stylosanthes scabra]|uniref:Uncharacterized protein n=1 Tax=Stylosanthes scabra TaxID=79078 RepID=A0ABU6XQB9_9FABA|nr:hypothetical protein [Stylosanthes scabra]
MKIYIETKLKNKSATQAIRTESLLYNAYEQQHLSTLTTLRVSSSFQTQLRKILNQGLLTERKNTPSVPEVQKQEGVESEILRVEIERLSLVSDTRNTGGCPCEHCKGRRCEETLLPLDIEELDDIKYCYCKDNRDETSRQKRNVEYNHTNRKP